MKTAESLANRLREVLTEGKWIADTNYMEQIKAVDWKDAITSIDDLNSIVKLPFHVHYYINGVAKVLEGGALTIRDKFSFDAPPIESEKDWKALLDKFNGDAKRFIKLVEEMPDQRLWECFIDEQYGNYHRNIDIMIEHSYYHLGQIVLIKKLLNNRKKTTVDKV